MLLPTRLAVAIFALALGVEPALAAPKKPAPPAKPAPTQPAPANPNGVTLLPPWVADPAIATTAGYPNAFVKGLHDRLTALAQTTPDKAALHAKIGDDLRGLIDWGEMGRLALGAKWQEVTPAQRQEFTDLMAQMVVNTYVKRFEPGRAVAVAWGAPQPVAGGKAEVRSVLTVGKTTADVHYFLLARGDAKGARWWVWDLTVDGASQVQSYKKSFGKVLAKEGWDGLITRMKKAAAKKV
jgi:phospholipid transport system substrate-binding protein